MRESVKGIIHVHSEFSRDGLCSIADLTQFARGMGFQFVCLTDHAEDLTLGDRKELRIECEKHSDESCVMIAGLEFRCHGDIHILGLGITDDIPGDDGVVVATEIREMGGLAILAHPGRNGYQCPTDLFAVLDGIEIWNAAYDGRFVPPLASLRLLRAARDVNPSVFGFGGADLHGLHRPPGVGLELPMNGRPSVHATLILDALQAGTFSIFGKYLSFGANAGPHGLARIPLWTFRKVYEFSKAVRDAALGIT
ncbi:MAG: PHP domain-containing protein [Candidatus Methylomirabilales bacterium]